MSVDYDYYVRHSSEICAVLESMAQFKEGIKYQYSPTQHAFIDSGYWGWGSLLIRTFNRQSCKQLSDDMRSFARSINNFACLLFNTFDQNSSKEWLVQADNLLENIAEKLPGASHGLQQLRRTYSAYPDKIQVIDIAVMSFSFDSGVVHTIDNIRKGIFDKFQTPFI